MIFRFSRVGGVVVAGVVVVVHIIVDVVDAVVVVVDVGVVHVIVEVVEVAGVVVVVIVWCRWSRCHLEMFFSIQFPTAAPEARSQKKCHPVQRRVTS